MLALPFSTLRFVDLSGSRAVAAQAPGDRRAGHGRARQAGARTGPQDVARGSAATASPTPARAATRPRGTAPSSAARTAPRALLVNFPGGDTARTRYTGQAHGPAPSADVRWFLNQIENLLPGTRAAYTGRAWEDQWTIDPAGATGRTTSTRSARPPPSAATKAPRRAASTSPASTPTATARR
ncbi:hypothetical protein ACU686_22565 [Yinghuangia aomiensis]